MTVAPTGILIKGEPIPLRLAEAWSRYSDAQYGKQGLSSYVQSMIAEDRRRMK